MVSKATVVFGGPSAEHDISILTGLQAERALSGAGVTVQCLYWARSDRWFLVGNGLEARDFLGGEPSGAKRLELRLGTEKGDGFYLKAGLGAAKRLDIGTVLSCFHGGAGEAGGAQALFSLAGIRATGGTVPAAALGMDKLAFGAVMATSGVPTLDRCLLSATTAPGFGGPYIVKPRFGGSSIGIEVDVADYDTARALLATSPHLREGAVLEPYRPELFDLEVSVRTAPELRVSEVARPLPPGDPKIYDYSAKYLHSDGLASAPRQLPADIPAGLREHIHEYAARVVELTGLTGILRIDFLSDGAEELYVNEVNSIPGALALYFWPDSTPAGVLGAALDEADRAVPAAARSYQEGVALQAAGGIAGKLAAYAPNR